MSTEKVFVGIDPGSKGAIAVIDSDGDIEYIEDMPTPEKFLEDYSEGFQGDYEVAVEDVHPLPGQSCTATFTYGQNFLLAKLIGMCYNISPRMVSPMKWKNHYGLKRIKGETKAAFKRRSVDKALELFPELRGKLRYSQDGRAEALLIANWLKETDEAAETDTKVHTAKK